MSEFAIVNDSNKEFTMATRKFRTTRTNWRRPTSRKTTPSRSRSFSKGGHPWTSQEISFMRKFYRNNETSWVARQLGRTVYSVRYKASSLNIRKSNPSVWRGNTGTTFGKTTNRPGKNVFPRYASSTRRTPRGSKSRRTSKTSRW